MLLSCLCVTRGRPELVAEAVRQFELQSYRDKELLILDDAGQYDGYHGQANVRVMSDRIELDSLARLRNLGFEMAAGEAVVIWDDDDWYFPWHLEAIAEALSSPLAKWARPSVVWDEWEPGQFIKCRVHNASGDPRSYCYHGAWAFTKRAWEQAGKYPLGHPGDRDSDFAGEVLRVCGPSADTISERFPEPSYCYRRHRCAVRGSEMSAQQMLDRRKESLPFSGTITGTWPEEWMRGLPQGAAVEPRRW